MVTNKLVLKIYNQLKIFFKLLCTIMQPNHENKGRFMETNLIMEGFKFMALGMGTVFMFLVILIFAMNIMSKIVHKYFPEPQVDVNAEINASMGTQQDNKNVIAAITAAVIHHRQG